MDVGILSRKVNNPVAVVFRIPKKAVKANQPCLPGNQMGGEASRHIPIVGHRPSDSGKGTGGIQEDKAPVGIPDVAVLPVVEEAAPADLPLIVDRGNGTGF